MFVKLTRLLSIAFLVASLTLFLTTPHPVFGLYGDCVMNPGDTCCLCHDSDLVGPICWEYELDGYEYCSDDLCPEDRECSLGPH